jgi:ATP-dependent helicase/nuclease subunit B
MSWLDALGQGATVVTASKRLARHLRWRFDRAQSIAGHAAWPSPDILPWNAWLERVWQASFLTGGTAGRLDLLTHQQARLVWQDVIAANPAGSGGVDVAGGLTAATGTVLDAWRLSRAWQIPGQQIKVAARTPDTDAFAAWISGYDERCRDQRWLDPWSLPEQLSGDFKSASIGLARPICFVGFDYPTAQQRHTEDSLRDLNLVVGAGMGQIPETLLRSRPLSIACNDLQHERDLAARWARHLLDETDNAIVGVIVPDLPRQADNFRRTFLDVLMPDWRSRDAEDYPVNIAHGTPLMNVGIIHVALIALQLPDGTMDYRQLGQLLRSPYLPGADEEASGRARVDLLVRERDLRDVHLPSIASAKRIIEAAPGFVALLQKALDSKGGMDGRRAPNAWASAIANFLKKIGWAKGRKLTSDEHQAIDAWQRLLETFASSGRVIGDITFRRARRLLADLAADHQFQPEGRMSGVQVMTPWDAVAHQFDAVWVSGLSSDLWPPAARPNPLIPLELQRRCEIPDATPERIRVMAGQTMRRLLTVAPVTCASWARQRNQEVLSPSLVLDSLTAADAESIPGYRGKIFRDRIHASGKLEVLRNDRAPPLIASEPFPGGSGLLKAQAACPARAFFEFRLGATEPYRPPYGIDARTRGIITHAALENLYGRIRELGVLSSLSVDRIGELIDDSIKTVLRKNISRYHPLAQTLIFNEQHRLRDLLSKLTTLERERETFSIDEIESSCSANIGTLKLNLRLDRIDRLSNGRRLVIDYKTGAVFSRANWRGERPGEPQLPLYAVTTDVQGIAVILLNQDGVKVLGVGAENAGVEGLQEPAKFTGDEGETWTSLVNRWSQDLERLAEEFAHGDCRIDRDNSKLVEKEFAMLSRIYDLAPLDPQ